MITVFLYGKLAEQFGKEHSLAVKSPAEACRALESNNPGLFYKTLHGNDYHVVRGEDLDSGEDVPEELLNFETERSDIHIVPAIEGSKSRGVFGVILGITLIAAAVLTAGITTGAFAAVNPLAGFGLAMSEAAVMGISMSSVALFGAAMVVGGVAQMLTPTPEISGGGGVTENVDPRKSFVFTGAANVPTQGVPVPVIYGEMEVGSVVISQSLTVENI